MTHDAIPRTPSETGKWKLPVTALLCFGLTAAVLMKIVPRFAEVFSQVRVPMPALTLGLLGISRFCCAYPILVALIATGVPASIHVWHPRAVRIARVALPILFFILWGWMIVALFLPLTCTLVSIGTKR